MVWFTLTSSLVCAWAMLRVFGGERERSLQEIQVRAAQALAAAKAQATEQAVAAGTESARRPTKSSAR